MPERTRARWLGRLRSSARQLVVLLGTTGTAAVKAVAEAVHLDATRRDLVEAYSATCGISPATRFASLAALVDRLERGIRFVQRRADPVGGWDRTESLAGKSRWEARNGSEIQVLYDWGQPGFAQTASAFTLGALLEPGGPPR